MLPNWEASAMGSHIFFDHFGDQKRPSHISYAKNDVLKDAYDPFEGGQFLHIFRRCSWDDDPVAPIFSRCQVSGGQGTSESGGDGVELGMSLKNGGWVPRQWFQALSRIPLDPGIE